MKDSASWYSKFGGRERFNIVLVMRLLLFELASFLDKAPELEWLRENTRWVYDDRAPDEGAHIWYTVSRSKDAAVTERPDFFGLVPVQSLIDRVNRDIL
jgi:phenol 2-monooxygenase